jgi:hypothetical protein
MTCEATLGSERSAGGKVLYMAVELSERSWRVLFASPAGRRRERSVAARDVGRPLEEIAAATVLHRSCAKRCNTLPLLHPTSRCGSGLPSAGDRPRQ